MMDLHGIKANLRAGAAAAAATAEMKTAASAEIVVSPKYVHQMHEFQLHG